jgi:hypothetical protein
MKNNTAILDSVNKIITFKYLDEVFTVDIKEGDIEDSWNSITDKNGVIWDFNFSWEDEEGCQPYLSIYGLKEIEGQLHIDTKKSTSIKIPKSNRDIFFKEERFKYIFNPTLPLVFRVFDKNDKLVLKTKSGNKASDEQVITGKGAYIIITDSNNATKRLD